MTYVYISFTSNGKSVNTMIDDSVLHNFH